MLTTTRTELCACARLVALEKRAAFTCYRRTSKFRITRTRVTTSLVSKESVTSRGPADLPISSCTKVGSLAAVTVDTTAGTEKRVIARQAARIRPTAAILGACR
jgi:hypothetical protein